MNAMAAKAGLVGAALDYVAGIGVNVTVGGIHGGIVGTLKIYFKIGKKVVTGNKVVGIRQTSRLRTTAAKMTLSTNKDYFARGLHMLCS